jgi:hypothetical protein
VSLWGDASGVLNGTDLVDTGRFPNNIEWRRESVDGIPGVYYIIHESSNKFLDSHGVTKGGSLGEVKLWGDGKTDNKGRAPQNLQWEFKRSTD